MSGRKGLRWQDLDHSQEALYDVVMTSRASRENGPIAEFLESGYLRMRWMAEALNDASILAPIRSPRSATD